VVTGLVTHTTILKTVSSLRVAVVVVPLQEIKARLSWLAQLWRLPPARNLEMS
jgi:hypothetical protein